MYSLLNIGDTLKDDVENMHNLFFQTVFAATAATIVSGAVAGRTKFTTYIMFSFMMTVVIYPISGHWVWQGDGWLTELGFVDFAGSSVVHSVGGWAALVGAILVGPRLGKYTNGKSIDIVIGGPPCQGFSIAVNIGRKFIDDPRNQLFKEFARIVSICNMYVFIHEIYKSFNCRKCDFFRYVYI